MCPSRTLFFYVELFFFSQRSSSRDVPNRMVCKLQGNPKLLGSFRRKGPEAGVPAGGPLKAAA